MSDNQVNALIILCVAVGIGAGAITGKEEFFLVFLLLLFISSEQ